jgi:hypothetical protein
VTIVHDQRGFRQLELPRKRLFGKGSTRTKNIQTSIWLAHGWRANCDMLFLLYEGNLGNPNPTEIAKVSTVYNLHMHTYIELDQHKYELIQSLIVAAQENTAGNKLNIQTLARQVTTRHFECRPRDCAELEW